MCTNSISVKPKAFWYLRIAWLFDKFFDHSWSRSSTQRVCFTFYHLSYFIQITLLEPSGRQWMEFYLASISTTYIRINITSTYGQGSVTIKEIELYEGTVNQFLNNLQAWKLEIDIEEICMNWVWHYYMHDVCLIYECQKLDNEILLF